MTTIRMQNGNRITAVFSIITEKKTNDPKQGVANMQLPVLVCTEKNYKDAEKQSFPEEMHGWHKICSI